MADPDKIPETQSDTQVTLDPSVEDAAQRPEIMESSMVSESQDFHLVDSDDAEKETQDEAKTSVASDETENCAGRDNAEPIRAGSVGASESQPLKDAANEVTENAGGIAEKEEAECAKIGSDDEPKKMDDGEESGVGEAANVEEKEASKEEGENEDDVDFIQSSQLETLSPLKKQISGLSVVMSQKRKADDTDETQVKFPRTCSQEDALSNVRKKLDDEVDEIFEVDKIKDRTDDEVISSIIIEETQENAESGESLQQVEQELEETLSQHPVDEDEEKRSDSEKLDDSNGSKEATAIEEKDSSEKDKPEESKTETDECIPAVDSGPKELSSDAKLDDEVTENPVESSETPERSAPTDDTKDTSPNIEASAPKSDEADPNAPTKDSRNSEACFAAPTSSARSRMSIEVIYDRATAPPEKKQPRELVEIDEDGEKIVLDSSQESCEKSLDKSTENKVDSSYKTCASTDYKSIDSSKESSGNDNKTGYLLTNGSTESRIADSDLTVSVRNDLFTTDSSGEKKIPPAPSPSKKMRVTPGKSLDSTDILSISDSEESFVVEERAKNKEQSSTSLNHDNSTIKTVPIEKELSILVKLKCLVCIDETTKEHVEKIITGIHCESASGDFSTSRHRNSDNSANLADISGNEKDASPGSVTSIPHPYQLNPRLSLASVASTSSSSSAGSLNAKIAAIKFQLPRAPPKHAKKMVTADSTSTEKRIDNEDALELIKKEWKNVDTVTCAVMNFANQELNNIEQHNGSTLRVDNSLERIRSSTPEVNEKDIKIAQSATPKRAAKRSRSAANVAIAKTTRAKNLRSSDSNGLAKDSPVVEAEKKTPSTSRKRKSSPDSSGTPSERSIVPSNETINDETEELLVGKQVFAKWSDNKYYPGKVIGKTKTKYRVNFYDGQSKLIIEDFIVPMPATLSPGLSVYATSTEDDYGSCGIVLEVKKVRDRVVYIVETDDSERIEVDIKNIFLTNDQVQVLKEESKIDMKSPPSTPKHLGKVTLENVVDGKRRSKRILTPVATTPKGKRGRASLQDKIIDLARPSASGISSSSALKFDDNPETTSDSNFSGNDDTLDSIGVQEEILGTPYEQENKGPQSATKGKGRGRKKSETAEIIATLGPIPNQNSDLFQGMSFLLSCVPLDTIERYQTRESSKDDSNSDPGTENEEEWSRKPFVRERLTAQLVAGGGKVYEDFESIPPEEYPNTKHITNVPNTTRKNLLCLSVGIKSYNHQWVIRSCQQNKLVSPSEEELPCGWSLLKKSYVDMFQRRLDNPFENLPVIVVIPVTRANKEFVSFWRKICENAGGVVMLVEKPDDTFVEGSVVLTGRHCPSWVPKKAASWRIPLVSPAWIIECLVQGDLVTVENHPRFKYNYIKRPSPHISNLKRR